MEDEAPDPEQITAAAPDRVFTGGDGYTFQGEPLKPFTVRRQFAAQALGNKLLCGRARIDQVACECGGNDPACELCAGTGERSTAYDGMLIDVAVLIYLCRCPQSEVELVARRPEKVLSNALAWAEDIDLSMGSPAFNEACEIYAGIMRALQEAQFKVTKTREGAKAKNG